MALLFTVSSSPFLGKFPESDTLGAAAVTRSREQRGILAAPGAEPIPYNTKDLLASLTARLEVVKNHGADIILAATRMFGSLWPSETISKKGSAFIAKLMECDAQLHLWRKSGARDGADIALQFVLSWYEGIDLGLLTRVRTGSKWCENPDWIARRKACANKLIQYSFCHAWNEGPSYLDVVDEEVVSEDEEGSEGEGSKIGDEAEDPEDGEVNPEDEAEAGAPPPHSEVPPSSVDDSSIAPAP